MKKLTIVLLPLLLLSLILGSIGCAGEKATPTPKVAAPVSVDASYDGKEVEMTAGSSLTVSLKSNATTGFKWELASNTDESVLEMSDQEYEAPQQTEPPLMGASGKEVWTFKALKEGQSIITLEYNQPWEGGTKAAEKFTLTVVVE